MEQVPDSDVERVRIAKTRDLALLLQNHQRKGKCKTCGGVKEFSQTEFAADVNFDRA